MIRLVTVSSDSLHVESRWSRGKSSPTCCRPAHNLHEGGVQHDANLEIKGQGDGVGLEVSGGQCFFSELRKHFMSPSERLFVSALVHYQMVSFSILAVRSTTQMANRRNAQSHASKLALDSRSPMLPPSWHD